MPKFILFADDHILNTSQIAHVSRHCDAETDLYYVTVLMVGGAFIETKGGDAEYMDSLYQDIRVELRGY
jgi:hypothetical protein